MSGQSKDPGRGRDSRAVTEDYILDLEEKEPRMVRIVSLTLFRNDCGLAGGVDVEPLEFELGRTELVLSPRRRKTENCRHECQGLHCDLFSCCSAQVVEKD